MSAPQPLRTADLRSPVVDAAMRAAADMLGMEVVFVGGLTDSEFAWLRMLGSIPGIVEGDVWPRPHSMCSAMLAGAPAVTADAAAVDAFASLPPVADYGVTSYIGVPIRAGGLVVGTLCGIDRNSVTIPPDAPRVLAKLAAVLEGLLLDALPDRVVLRRSPTGWRVGATDELDVISAMVLADLLANELVPSARPARPDPTMTETERLRLSLSQLEHALASRVVVEQAIGVLCERQHLTPRVGFERLRKAARSRGRRVHDLAAEVVRSAADRSVPLPPELAPRH